MPTRRDERGGCGTAGKDHTRLSVLRHDYSTQQVPHLPNGTVRVSIPAGDFPVKGNKIDASDELIPPPISTGIMSGLGTSLERMSVASLGIFRRLPF